MHKNKKFQQQKGFGLIELMVSISIIVLVMSVILARHDSYNGAVLLRSQAYDIALKIREVQMQAVSATGDEDNFRRPLGVCFDIETPNYYHIFADDGDYECEEDEYLGQRGNIDPRFRIQSLNLVSALTSADSEPNLVILFERPNFDARFFVNGIEQTGIDGVEIELLREGANSQSTSAGDLRVMEISRTGQILVQPVNTKSGSEPCVGRTCPVDDPPDDPDCEKDGSCPEECEKTNTCDDGDNTPPQDCQKYGSCPEECEKTNTCDDGDPNEGGGTIELPPGDGEGTKS